ncbi:MAG: adenylate cyclase [Cellvibrionaceae bacterium]|jgi:adenylate cyclase
MNTYRKILSGMVLSNTLGAFVIFFYFAYIDIEAFETNLVFWRGSNADWITFTIVMILLAIIDVLIANYYGRQLAAWDARLVSGLHIDSIPPRIVQWAAAYPIIIASISMISWITAGVFFAQGGLDFGSTNLAIFVRTFFGISIIGGITTSVIIFMLTDLFWRERFAHFFPDGRFSDNQLMRVSVSRRLLAVFMLTGVVPLLILGSSAWNGALALVQATADPVQVIGQLERIILFVVVIGLISNLLLSYFSSRSIVQPMLKLSVAMGKVSVGDLSSRVSVVANDEIGELTSHFNLMLEKLEQGQIMRDLFGRYVSQEVANQVIEQGASLGGENVQATALFADIRDFTGLTERLPAQQVVDILNRYYTYMVDVIVEAGGIVNKFGGDSLLAIFGVPIKQEGHASYAIQAAIAMKRALITFNLEQKALGLQPLEIGIGISSGDMVAGNIGGKARLEYTVIGDPVNLAARLQSLTKEWGTTVLLSEDTQRCLTDYSDLVEPVEKITVRGKKEPTLVYKLVDQFNRVVPQ